MMFSPLIVDWKMSNAGDNSRGLTPSQVFVAFPSGTKWRRHGISIPAMQSKTAIPATIISTRSAGL